MRNARVRPPRASQTPTLSWSVEWIRMPSGETARDLTGLPCRRRTVPMRATAPGGRGSPCASASGAGCRATHHPTIMGNKSMRKLSIHLCACWNCFVAKRPHLLVVVVKQNEDVVLRIEIHGADPGVAGPGFHVQVGPGVGAHVIGPGDRVSAAAELRGLLAALQNEELVERIVHQAAPRHPL